MKKKYLLGAALLMASNLAFAGGYLTNTNQHIAFLRMIARGASTDIDAIYSNPAGLAFMQKEGLTLSLNIQNAAQNRNIDASYRGAALGLDLSAMGMGKFQLGGNSYQQYYKGKASAPVVPSLFAAYKKGDWVFSGSFAVVGGGGKCSFDNGLPMFDSSVRTLYDIALGAAQLANGLINPQGPMTGKAVSDMYTINSAMEGRQFIYGVQLGATYKVNDWLSVFAGGRMNYFSGGYEGFLHANVNSEYAQAYQLGLQTALGLVQQLNPELAGAVGGMLPEEMLKSGQFNLELDCSQTGWGLTPILGADVRYKGFTVGLKYEFQTNLNLENKTKSLIDPTGKALDAFKDGVNTPSDIPALFTAAVGYEFLPTLRATVEYHRYFDKQAGMADNKQEYLDRGTNEYLAGIEWDAHKYVTLSGGYQRTDYGLTGDFQSDTSFSCDSYSLGFGAKINLNDHLGLNVAYFWTTYTDFNKEYESALAPGMSISGSNVYSRTNKVFGLGIDYTF
ncbi:MAG: OmpP1/FadL family transporter [Parabacteroides sp.]